jgi:hypothetical protein
MPTTDKPSADAGRDYIAIGKRGVYAICSTEVDAESAREFIDTALNHGDSIQIVPTAEAVERHLAYLRQDPNMSAMIDAAMEP